MKNKIIGIIVALLCLCSVKTYAEGFQLGAKFGANVFKVDGQAFDREFRFGYHLGAFAHFDLGGKWGLQPEMLWSNVNTKVGTSLDTLYSFNNISDISLDYLSIPIIVTYSPSELISLHAGPQFGILVNPNETTLKNGKNAFTSGDLSLILGAQLNLGPIKTGLRYVIGLNNLNDISDQDSWTNQGFQIYVGFAFL
jgi:hypothetical protein